MTLPRTGHVARILAAMQTIKDWEVRHGGMLGLKYAIAVRKESVIEHYLKSILPVIKQASTASVMNLIAEMCQNIPSSNASSIGGGEESVSDLSILVGRLFPFFRHNMFSVRRSVLKICRNLVLIANPSKSKEILDQSSLCPWLMSVLGDTLHHVFVNIILEQRQEISEASHELWNILISTSFGSSLSETIAAKLHLWFSAVSTPPGCPLDPEVFAGVNYSVSASRARAQRKRQLGIARTQGTDSGVRSADGDNDDDPRDALTNLDDFSASVRMRLSGVRAIGSLIWRLQSTQGDLNPFTNEVLPPTVPPLLLVCSSSRLSSSPPRLSSCPANLWLVKRMLSSSHGTHVQVGALVLEEWASSSQFGGKNEGEACGQAGAAADSPPVDSKASSFKMPEGIQEILDSKLASVGQTDYPYAEIAHLSAKWKQDLKNMLALFAEAKVKEAKVKLELESLGVMQGLAMAEKASKEWEQQLAKAAEKVSGGTEGKKARDKAVRQVYVTIGQLQEVQTNLHTSVLSAVASVLVAAKNLPAKVASVIRSIMDSIQHENNEDLQRRSARSLVGLLRECSTRKTCPNGKIINNLAAYLCEDTTFTPRCTDAKPSPDSVTLDDLTYVPPEDSVIITALDNNERVNRIKKRGASMALEEIAKGMGQGLFDILPSLLTRLVEPIKNSFEDANTRILETAQAQEVVDAFQVANCLLPSLHKDGMESIKCLLPFSVNALQSMQAPIRQMAARFLAQFCSVASVLGMETVIRKVMPLLGDTDDASRRLGATEALFRIVDVMDMAVLPFAIFFVVPILGRMSDPHPAVRQTVTKCFATLLRLLPLEAGIPDPEGLSQDLVLEKQKERRFLEQLLDTSKIDNYEIPVKIAADLRRYQQEGVNWMAFLMKYQLHGILCDDMGLGKTLQTICIISSDHHNRRKKFAENRDPGSSPLPSLVVCPPTLVGHWDFEISKFLPDSTLQCVQFVGSPTERAALKESIVKGGDIVVVTSYETLRNDIDFLGKLTFNYVVLDEGHMIKNAKSKTTQAVKAVRANHRLILSGTPIQNNVLELWSLFDFLMPGFLGSEKYFNQAYSKPIRASRNAKCSSQQAEAGALALEALHRQVLPFMLRRTKTEVLSDLPPKIIQDYYCDLSPLQQRLYNDFAAKQKANEMVASAIQGEGEEGKSKEGGGIASHIFQALQYLRKLANHPKLVLGPSHPEMSRVMQELKSKNMDLSDISLAPKVSPSSVAASSSLPAPLLLHLFIQISLLPVFLAPYLLTSARLD
eukprot:765948-Hanusia_phi.AAC.5